jgi:hypothetical protein
MDASEIKRGQLLKNIINGTTCQVTADRGVNTQGVDGWRVFVREEKKYMILPATAARNYIWI